MPDPFRVAIVGASGYGGGELLRLLLSHPRARIACATSRRHAGEPVAKVHENLEGGTDLVFSGDDPAAAARGADAVFFALPHGEAARRMEAVLEAAPEARIVDLSGDFRLQDVRIWEQVYGKTHPAPGLIPEFTYGLTEAFRDRIAGSRRVANPGCFATAAILALAPLAEKGLLEGSLVLNGVTGSSGAGADPRPTTHHPERAADFRAYRPLAHQHLPEITAALGALGGRDLAPAMVPHSAPLVRGIFTTAYLFPREPIPPQRLMGIYATRYGGEPFVRIRETTPRVAVVAATNYCDVAVAASDDGARVVVMAAIDNLVKGMAGQAVQNLNLMCGFPEETGLLSPGTHP